MGPCCFTASLSWLLVFMLGDNTAAVHFSRPLNPFPITRGSIGTVERSQYCRVVHIQHFPAAACLGVRTQWSELIEIARKTQKETKYDQPGYRMLQR